LFQVNSQKVYRRDWRSSDLHWTLLFQTMISMFLFFRYGCTNEPTAFAWSPMQFQRSNNNHLCRIRGFLNFRWEHKKNHIVVLHFLA
jgi:hypothetical protein